MTLQSPPIAVDQVREALRECADKLTVLRWNSRDPADREAADRALAMATKALSVPQSVPPLGGVAQIADTLRSNWMAVQAQKRGDQPLALEPAWAIINAVPAVLAILDRADEFEAEAASEAAASPPAPSAVPAEADNIERELAAQRVQSILTKNLHADYSGSDTLLQATSKQIVDALALRAAATPRAESERAAFGRGWTLALKYAAKLAPEHAATFATLTPIEGRQ